MSKFSRDHVGQFYAYGVDVETKTIDFSSAGDDEDDLSPSLAVQTIKSLRLLDRIRPEEPITMLINCGGGDVAAGLAVYDEIRRCTSQVHTVVTGVAYSMAAWVLQAGDVRKANKHASIMIHDGEGGVVGSMSNMQRWLKYHQETDKICESILLDRIRVKHPDYTRLQLQKLLKVDTILWAQQAIDLGLLDEVVE